MRSLKLKIEDLSVDTFATEETPAGRGTVRAHESYDDGGEQIGTGYVSCDRTCETCPTGIANACCV